VAEPDTLPQKASGLVAAPQKIPAIVAATTIFGLTASLLGVLGLAGMYLGIAAFRSIAPGYQTMAFSTAVLLIVIGAILALGALRPFGRGVRLGVQAAMGFIIFIELIELPLNITGHHGPFESLMIEIGNMISGQLTSPISPATIILVILASLGCILLMIPGEPSGNSRSRNGAGFLGLVVALTGFTIILSYLYGVPIMYGTGLIPVAAPTAIAFLAIGAGLMTSAGLGAVPLSYLSGESVRAHLLRTFLPLTIVVILAGSGLEITRRVFGETFDAVLTAASIVVFSLIVGFVIFRASDRVGRTIDAAERDRRKAEEDLRIKNTELEASFEELAATEEELRQNYEELAKSQQAMQKSEALLNLSQKITRAGGWEYDIAADQVTWTDEVYAIHGVSKDYDPGSPKQDIRFYSPGDQAIITGAFQRAVTAGEAYDLELQLDPARGQRIWVRTIGQAEQSGGKVVRVFGNIIDITARKRAAEELRRANAYNRSLIEASLDPLVTISPEGKISDVNEATINVTGFPREALIGTDFSRYFTDPGRAKAGYETVFREGSVQDYPLEIRHTDGRVTPVLYNASVYRDEKGTITGAFAAARDITGQKRAESAMKTERQRLYDVLETLPVYVCLLDKDYHMPFANRYFRETFGESHGRRCYEFLFNLDKPCENCESYKVMKTRARHHWYWTGPNGRDYDIYDFPFTDSDGSFNILEMGIDITDQKRAEAALQKAHDELEERVGQRTTELAQRNEELGALNEELTATQDELQRNITELGNREKELGRALAEKEVLLSEIHHRVKNNLTAFISLLSLEGAIEDTPAGKTLRQELQNRARSMSLIHETLYRTKLYDEVDMGIYLTTLVEHIGNSFQSSPSVKTIVEADGVMLDIGRATPAGLIVNELVTNSFKYAFAGSAAGKVPGEPPTITITLAKKDGEYRMTVSDNGPGLPPGFDLAKTQTLGLKLVNFLAKHQMRAKTEVRSEKGTEFVFSFKENTGAGKPL
jgi:PAS domain S-box-containing protein